MAACGWVRRLDADRRASLPAGVLLVALWAGALAGCTNTGTAAGPGARSLIHLPDQALLSPPSAPRCEFKAETDPGAERAKLDYERQCYRHAELIVRGRLQRLQASVGETIRSVKDSEK